MYPLFALATIFLTAKVLGVFVYFSRRNGIGVFDLFLADSSLNSKIRESVVSSSLVAGNSEDFISVSLSVTCLVLEFT